MVTNIQLVFQHLDSSDYSDSISDVGQTYLNWQLQGIHQDYGNVLAGKYSWGTVVNRILWIFKKQVEPFLGWNEFFELSILLRTFKHCQLEFFV